MQPAPFETDVAVETPEHIVFRYRLAGPGRRLIAYAIDLLLCYAALAVVVVIVVVATIGAGRAMDESHELEKTPALGVGIVLLLLFAVQWVYFAVLEGWRGATPGKAAMRCRVISRSGRPAGFAAAALRNILRAADALPLTYTAGLVSVAGLVSMAATKHFQRLGDLVAGTIVIVVERADASEPLVLSPPMGPDEGIDLPSHVTLDADERLAIEMFLRRRARLGPARAVDLARMLGPWLEARFGVRPADPARALAVVYEIATSGGRGEGPPSLRPAAGPWT